MKINQFSYLLLFIFIPGISIGLNFKKLGLQEITLKNNLNHQIKISIERDYTCASCKDTTSLQEEVTLSSLEHKTIAYKKCTITAIKSLDHTTDFFVERNNLKQKKHIIHIINKNKNSCSGELKFTELNFDLSMKLIRANDEYQNYMKKKVPPHMNYMLPQGIHLSTLLADFKSLYEKNKPSNIIPAKQPKIPFIIHQLWFGITGDMPLLYKQWQKTYKKNHPAWRFICWNTAMIEKHFQEKFFNQDLFDAAQKNDAYLRMSDLARYEIMNKFGGFYSDCDAECYESLIPLHMRYDFFTSLEPVTKYPLGCALNAFGTIPHHPIIKTCILLCKERTIIPADIDAKIKELVSIYQTQQYSFYKTLYSTGPYLFLASILHGINKENATDIVFPNNYCCHWFKPTLESFCCHHVILPAIKNAYKKYWHK